MKDKEKQIEEMARIIAFDLCPYGKLHAKLYANRAKCASNDNFAECTKINKVVEKLYNAGYRKITEDSILLSKTDFDLILPPNSVVLSREELNNVENKCFDNGFDKGAEIGRANASKETAEKILQIIDFIDKKYQNYAKEELQSSMIAKAFTAVATEIKIEIAKQFDVKIKEN